MGHFVMIDLETLGSAPGCSIIAIGAAAATEDGCILDEFYRVVSRESCAFWGLHESEQTLEWWSRQSEAAREVLRLADTHAARPLPVSLIELSEFVKQQGKVQVYGNGSDFDNAILAAAAHATGVELGWPFWMNRCYRTMKSRYPHVRLERIGTHHNALDDAMTQAEHLGRINREAALTWRRIDMAAEFTGWIADRLQSQTARRILGLRLNTIRRPSALDLARGIFDAIGLGEPFAHPDFDWTRAGAANLADVEMSHWDAD